jgi:hypothetical protein
VDHKNAVVLIDTTQVVDCPISIAPHPAKQRGHLIPVQRIIGFVPDILKILMKMGDVSSDIVVPHRGGYFGGVVA